MTQSPTLKYAARGYERKSPPKQREYFRKCGICGQRDEQGNMVRTYDVDNGWCCRSCWGTIHAESIALNDAMMDEY